MKTLTLSLVALLFTVSTTLHAQLQLPPILNNPLNNAVNVVLNPNLDWTVNVALGNLLYSKVQIARDVNFSDIVHENLHVTVNNLTVPLGVLTQGQKYYWRVRSVINLGIINIETGFSTPFSFTTTITTGITQTGTGIPGSYKLYDNYPNPFNPSTVIKFDVKENTNVKLSVFSITGETVAELVNSNLSAGTYEATWDAAGLASGYYFYRMEAGNFTSAKKMILTK